MTQNWPFAKITDILQKKLRSVIVSQNHYLNKILDVHPLYLSVRASASASASRTSLERMVSPGGCGRVGYRLVTGLLAKDLVMNNFY